MTNIRMNEKRYKWYTLKVSLDRNCYRHLHFPGSFTLEDLADMILTAFDFDNDHLHAFFMDGKPYSHAESYYSRYADEPGTPTNKIKVQALELSEKQKFLFVFDFGDDWHFYCEVKKIGDIPEKAPYISDIVGEAPEQYPDYDDYEEEPSEEFVKLDPYVPLEPELYRAAFDFKKAKPWEMLTEEDVFAVKFSGSEVGYVVVTGAREQTYGIALYIGGGGIACLADNLNKRNLSDYDDIELFNFKLKQDFIMMSLKCKSEIEPKYVSEIQSYAKENGISLRGKNSFPDFIRHTPQKAAWSVTNEKERKYLIQALDAAAEFAKRLKTCAKSEFRFGELPILPLMTKKKDGYSCGSAMLPKPTEKEYKPLITSMEFKNFRSKADLECKIVDFPSTILRNNAEIPEYPVAMAFVNTKRGDLMSTDVFPYDPIFSCGMLDSFIMELNYNKIVPKTITVSDKRTEALLSDICSRCGVKLKVEESLPVLDELVRGLVGGVL